jgi:hypothetical protein
MNPLQMVPRTIIVARCYREPVCRHFSRDHPLCGLATREA